jgi:outer membrane protein assembly factor BamB
MKHFQLKLFIFSLTAFAAAGVTAESIRDWPMWRGTQSSGSIHDGKYPRELGLGEIAWKVELPGKGCSTPIVFEQKIYVTAPVDGLDAVLCFDASGKELWRTTLGPEDPGKHPNASGSNSSPVTDGAGVFAYFKSGMMVALEMDGSIRWQENIVDRFGKVEMFWDYGSSPVLTGSNVILIRMHAGDSWLAAFDKQTGEMAWKADRNYETPVENDQCYTTPLVLDYQGKESILSWGAEHVTIHNAANGNLVWSSGGFNPDGNRLWPAIASPVVVGDVAIIAHGRADRQNPRLFGVQLTDRSVTSESSRLWSRDDIGTFVPTPVVLGDRVVILGDQGEIDCVDPQTGRTIWQARLPKHRAKFYASPLMAGNILYAVREDGVVFIAELEGDQLNFLAQSDIGESVIGSPIPFGDGLLIRGENHLFRFRSQL